MDEVQTVGCNGCYGMLLRSFSLNWGIIPSAASNIGSRWLSDGSLFCYCPQLKSHSVQAHRQPTTNNWSMPKYECPVLFEPRQDRVPHRIGEPTFVVTTLPFNSSFCAILLPALLCWYWISGHSPESFLHVNIYLRVSFWGIQYATVHSFFILFCF